MRNSDGREEVDEAGDEAEPNGDDDELLNDDDDDDEPELGGANDNRSIESVVCLSEPNEPSEGSNPKSRRSLWSESVCDAGFGSSTDGNNPPPLNRWTLALTPKSPLASCASKDPNDDPIKRERCVAAEGGLPKLERNVATGGSAEIGWLLALSVDKPPIRLFLLISADRLRPNDEVLLSDAVLETSTGFINGSFVAIGKRAIRSLNCTNAMRENNGLIINDIC